MADATDKVAADEQMTEATDAGADVDDACADEDGVAVLETEPSVTSASRCS